MASEGTLYKNMTPTLGENQLTSPEHTLEEDSKSTAPPKTYITNIKFSTPSVVWNRIVNDDKVQSTLSAVATNGHSDETPYHHAASKLLNYISNAYIEATVSDINPETTPAIVFSSSRGKYIPGDYLRTSTMTDITASMGIMSKLVTALNASEDVPFDDQANFPQVLGICEWEQQPGGLDRVVHRLSVLKRYRPDLPTVHGLLLGSDNLLTLASLNACGSWSSNSVAIEAPVDHAAEPSAITGEISDKGRIPSIDSWIAYVVLLYQTHSKRDTRFSLVASNDAPASALWQVRLYKFTPTVRPFYAMVRPSRMTWASFALDPSRSDPASSTPSLANGFFKTSWQDVGDLFRESKLLRRAHKQSWLPGLVRPWSTARDPSRRISLYDPPGCPHPMLEEEHVYLASIGHPLSQCGSALHFLKTIYDAAETHLQLIRRGILHGDMSWFNVLCNPWHDDATLRVKPVAKGIPCIDFILTGDAENSQPCALVLDLDHAAAIRALYADDHDAGWDHKSGTPMFISIELSSEARVHAGSFNRLEDLVERLSILDGRPELFARAFPGPDGDDNFMDNFHRVVEREKERMISWEGATTDPYGPHKPQHDVESLYWILVWGLSRACPLGHHPHGTVDDHLSQFINSMLQHRLGGREEYRSGLLYGFGIGDKIFHPLLRDTIYPVVRDLGTYLAIPWLRYNDIVEADHAHVASRRLLLPLIDDIHKENIHNIFFDTTRPRTGITSQDASLLHQMPSAHETQVSAARAAEQAGSAPTPSSTGSSTEASTRASLRPIKSNSRCMPTPPAMSLEAPPLSAPAQGCPSVLRTEDDSDSEYEGGSAKEFLKLVFKRLKPPVNDDKVVVGEKRPAVRDEINERAHKRARKDGRDPRDVDALIEMFWNDRNLWFGSGFRSLTEAKACVVW